MRTLLSALAGALVTFFLGAIEFVAILPGYFDAHFGRIARPAADINAHVWAIFLEKLVQAIALAIVYRRWARPDRSAVSEGAIFGTIAAVLISIPWCLSMWTNYQTEFGPLAVLTVADFVRFPIAGIAIALVQSRRRTS
jgi:hypothetical protein